jgi:hypothetical protein
MQYGEKSIFIRAVGGIYIVDERRARRGILQDRFFLRLERLGWPSSLSSTRSFTRKE